MDDTSSSFNLLGPRQSYDRIGRAKSLAFTRVGENVDDTLSSWELGNGTFKLSDTEDGTTDWLVFTQLWKNETMVAGALTGQVFDARGLEFFPTIVDGETVYVINANVSEALLNRSVINGVVGEHLSLEATGLLNISEEGGCGVPSISMGNSCTMEYIDVDGERILQHSQFGHG